MKANFNFNNCFVDINRKSININIKNVDKYKNFIDNYLPQLQEKYKDFSIRINKITEYIITSFGKYKVYNNQNLKLNTTIETIGRISNIDIIQKYNDYHYDITLENINEATALKIYLVSEEKISWLKIGTYILVKGKVAEVPKKDYEKQMNFNKFIIRNPAMKLIEEKEIKNIIKNNNNKRRPLCLNSCYSTDIGILNSERIYKRSDEIDSYCFTDKNTLNFAANNDDVPLGIKGYIKTKDKYYSIYIYIDCKDSEIEYNDEKIKVNEGIRFINKCISENEKYNDAVIFDVLELMNNKDKLKIGSMDHNGLVFRSILSNRYDILSEYLDLFDIIGIESMDSLETLCNKGYSINNLKKVNHTIYNLCLEKNIPLVFCDNAVVLDKEDREFVKEFMISSKIKEENIKDKIKFINEQKQTIKLNDIRYIKSIPEITEDLIEQGFDLKVVEQIIFDELLFNGMLPKKSEITVIPNYLFVDNNKEDKDKLLKIVKLQMKDSTDKELLKKELNMVFKKNYQNVFIAAYTVSKLSRGLNYPIGERGTASCMYLCYILGISNINPKEYNLDQKIFLGPNMEKVPDIDINISSDIIKQVIEDFNKYFPNTMKASICSYYKENSIKSQILFKTMPENLDIYYACNILSDKLARIQPHNSGIMLLPSIDTNYIFPTIKYNGESIPGYPYEYIEKVIPKIDILSKNDLNILKEINNYKSLDLYMYKNEFDKNSDSIYELINKNSENISELNTDYARKIIEYIKPKKFNDLIIIQGLLHGKGILESALNCIDKKLKIISSREDLLNILEKYGINNSFDIMEKVRKGNYEKLTDEEKTDLEKLPIEYQNAIKKIQYLFPKSHAIAYAKQSYFSAYYNLYKDEILKSRLKDKDTISDSMDIDDFEEYL